MGDMFAQPVAARLRGIGAEYGSGSIASNMCRDERLDIRAAITNAAADSDVWDATTISTFAVEGAQATAQILGCFARCKKSLALIDVHDGVACQRQPKSGVARQFMAPTFLTKCSNQLRFSLWFSTPPYERSADGVVRNSARLWEVRIDKARGRGDKLQARAHKLP
jgi:hypothetical protein